MTTKQKQCLLAYLAQQTKNDTLDPGKIDGIDGRKTRAALAAFRSIYGCGEDGLLTVICGIELDPDTPDTGTFWDEIEFYAREEFRCKCGGVYCDGFPAEPREDLVRIADELRRHFGRPARVVSGLRCQTWNRIQGGVADSQHMYGEACDLYISGVSGDELLKQVQAMPGVRYAYRIAGSDNVHFDVPKGAR